LRLRSCAVKDVKKATWLNLNLNLTLTALLLMAGCSAVPRTFNPRDPIAPKEFSHQVFHEVLRAHVERGVVDYPAIATDPVFERYVQQLDRIDPSSLPTRQDRLVFWINAYNAFAIKGILDGYSPLTLFGRYRYFIGRRYRVGGQSINLYDLERKLLIPDFREPRIHFAIVCASSSCPRLQPWAYAADKLEEQLEQSARGFINDPTRNQFDRKRKIAYLSMIFKWFEEDFVVHSGSLLKYVRPYVADPDLARELEFTPYTVQFLEYDWRLNGPPPVKMQHAGLS
jgi:hypothetical protein